MPQTFSTNDQFSFYQLVATKQLTIRIPRIQRDYAQGRKTAAAVREGFLASLKQYLKEPDRSHDLDFVYGSINNNDFIPLDGQQRLTTLFLLHWYLAVISGNQASFKTVMLTGDAKARFVYDTRTSSTEFCQQLISHIEEFSVKQFGVEQKEKDSCEAAVSDAIIDASWFFRSWSSDPTVRGMLTMLNAIHEQFNDFAEAYELLMRAEKPVITFRFLDMAAHGLSDDLYIKMNSRGKELTAFENFKSKLEQKIASYEWEPSEHLHLDSLNKGVSPAEYFNHKIDTSWADLFWHFKDQCGDDNSFDDEMLNIIRALLIYKSTLSENVSNAEYLIDTFCPTFMELEKRIILDKDAVLWIITVLDLLTGNGNTLVHHNCAYYDERGTFIEMLKDKPSYEKRLLFYAYIRFLEANKEFTHDQLHSWTRVIRNLVVNRIYDNITVFKNSIIAIDQLVQYSADIYGYLRNEEVEVTSFQAHQVKEECIKAHLVANDEWRSAIESIEKNPLFTGQIMFLLEFAGVLDYYKSNQAYPVYESTIRTKFCMYTLKAEKLFPDSKYKPLENFPFERAVLTKGDYLLESSYDRYNFLTGWKDNNQRDFGWKVLLRVPMTENDLNRERRHFVKMVFDDVRFTGEDVTAELSQIATDKTNTWRDIFIEFPAAIKYSNQGYIHFVDEHDIIVYCESQRNHYHRELYSYEFFLRYLKGNAEKFSPFTATDYHSVKSENEVSCAYLDKWVFEDAVCAMDIFYDKNTKVYKCIFFKRLNNIDSDSQLVPLCLSFELESCDKDGYAAYRKVTESKVKTIAFLTDFCISAANLCKRNHNE